MSALRLTTVALVLIATETSLAFQQLPFDWPRLAFPDNLTNFRRAADLNGDGHLDLVALNGHLTIPSFNYEVWLGDGQGHFSVAYQAALQGPHLGKYECAQLIDLSGDGRLDLVLCQEPATSGAPGSLSVWPGESNGSFASTSMRISVPGPILALALGDADGDTKLDLAVLRRDSSNASVRYASWILSRPGQGYVQAAEALLPLGNEGSVCALDADQDGNADLACGVGTNFAVLRTLSGGVLSPIATWSIAVNFTPSTIAATSSDLDGDGDTDLLAFVARSDRAATIPLLISSGFAMTQGAAIERTFSSGTRAIAAETIDWDLDGDRDIIWRINDPTHPYGRILFYANQGLATYALASELSTRGDGYLVHLGDFDGDALPDLIGPREFYHGRARFPEHLNQSATVFQWQSIDIDEDGDLDRLGLNANADENDGTGHFVLRSNRLPPPIVPPPATRNSISAIGDFNLDGRMDFIATYFRPISTFPFQEFDSHSLLFDDGRGGYTEQHPVTNQFQMSFGSRGERTPVADLDGNGTGDYLGGYAIHFLQANGMFGPLVSLFDGTPVVVGDVDGDQDIDVIVGQYFPMRQHLLYRNQGQAIFASPEPLPFAPGLNDSFGTLMDLDEDGDLDFVTTASTPANFVLIYENSGGNFAAPLILDSIVPTFRLMLADLDEDGWLDLVGSAESSAAGMIVHFRRTSAALQYAAPIVYAARGAANFASDIDADGDMDLIGSVVHRNLLREGPSAGVRKQVGLGSVASPILGTPGPVQVQPGPLEHRLRRGLGGSLAFWTIGLQSSVLIDFPVQGVITRNWPWVITFAVPLSGPPQVPGAGSVDLELAVPQLAGGLTFYHQAFVFDPSATGSWRASNALELTISY